MRYGFGAAAAPATPAASSWGQFFTNLGQNAVTALVGQMSPAIKPPAVPTAPAAPGAPAVVPGAAATAVSVAKSAWPIVAVAGAGVLGLLAVIILKKKKS